MSVQDTWLEIRDWGNVTFGDSNIGKIWAIGKISIDDDAFVKNILFKDGLHHNLISASQLCDNQMIFEVTRKMGLIDLEEIRNSRVCW